MKQQVNVIPNVQFSLQNPNLQEPQIISIGSVQFTASVIFYSQFFAVTQTAQTVPFTADPSASYPQAAQVAYVRNTDPSALISVSFGVPTPGGASNGSTYYLAPGGFIIFFNPAASANGFTVPSGVGILSTTGGPIALVNASPGIISPSPVYAEVLIAQ